jgi:ATP-dependent DNA helicase RecG
VDVGVTRSTTPQVTPQVNKNDLLEFCKTPRSRDEMQNFMKLKDREYFRLNILRPLIENAELILTIPDKPTSSKQKYYTNPNTLIKLK